MNLFLFTVREEFLALPGDEVVQVLPPGSVREVHGSAGERFAEVDGCRLPVWGVPGGAQQEERPASESTFLRIAVPGDGEALVSVDLASGLMEVADGDVLPVPEYLFPPGQAVYRGLFQEGGRNVGLLEARQLGPRPRGA